MMSTSTPNPSAKRRTAAAKRRTAASPAPSRESVSSAENRPLDDPQPFWQEWENTSDEDVARDTYGPARQHALERALG